MEKGEKTLWVMGKIAKMPAYRKKVTFLYNR